MPLYGQNPSNGISYGMEDSIPSPVRNLTEIIFFPYLYKWCIAPCGQLPFSDLMVSCFIDYTLISKDGLGFNANLLLTFTMRFSTSSRVMLRTMLV